MKSQTLLPWLVWLTKVQGSEVQTAPSTSPDQLFVPRELLERSSSSKSTTTVQTTVTITRRLRYSKPESEGLESFGGLGLVDATASTATTLADSLGSNPSFDGFAYLDTPSVAITDWSKPLGFQKRTVAGSANSNYLDATLAISTTSGIIPVNMVVPISTSVAPSGTVQLLPSLQEDVEPHTSGVVRTSLDLLGAPTKPPLLTSSIPSPTSLLQPISSPTTATTSELPQEFGIMAVADIFAQPIATTAPPSSIKKRSDHPVPRKGITANAPIQTNKFYANFFLGNQLSPTFTFPYSIAWAGGTGASGSWGITISHIETKQRVFGDAKYNKASAYYINPIGIQSMVISAKELGKDTVVSMDSLTDFSGRVLLSKDSKSQPAISFPIMQGMAYVTANCNGATPLIQSGVYFKTMTRVTKDPKSNVVKYNFNLEDGTTWHLYAYKTKGNQLDLQVVNNGLAQSKKPFYGTIQIAKDPGTTGSQAILDDGAGIYPVTNTLSGTANGAVGTYTFKFTKAGHPSGNLYMFALPHHVSSFDSATKSLVKKFQLQSTTKGIATLVRGTQWTMEESSLPVNMNFAPWSPTRGIRKKLSTKAKNAIRPVASKEVSQNMAEQSNLDSMYFSGKVSLTSALGRRTPSNISQALAKFGAILYVINDMLGDKALAQSGLGKLKSAFATFAANKQKYPLVYESKYDANYGDWHRY